MRFATSLTALALAGCGAPMAYVPEHAPVAATAATSEDERVAHLLSRMSLERKVAQLIMPDISAITPDDVEKYRFGVILNGGNSGPGGNDLAPAPDWLALADAYWDASTKALPDGEPVIPSTWATDAVHGHANVMGATIFPHNIALGATRDPGLIREIGAATAKEIEITGIDWTFAPTIAVARDDRWGRTYESYSEEPALVAHLGAAMTEGLQGKKGSEDYLGEGRVIATAKHFFGDGGTYQGVDQGDVNGDIEMLKSIHAAPYPPVIAAGVESVMASFNSINGKKMHGNRALLTDYLRGELGFDGLVVGDWNGHGQVAGCTNTDCPQALMAGLDVYMVPEDWKGLYETLLAQVRSGEVPVERVDEAAGRVLRLKIRAGLLDGEVRPSQRANAGEFSQLGSAAHRDIARRAVAQSLVLLKNDGVLPLKPSANLLVAGQAANSIAQQAGGWTLTWQGGGELDNDDFPGATSIYAGIAAAAGEAGGSAVLSEDGRYASRPDAAIVVFGEEPYAEFAGDRKDLVWRDEEGLALLKQYRDAGIPAVALFLSGRPMWVNRELNAANAFVAAWLPGSEGQGVADGLYGKSPFSGRLGFSWPGDCNAVVNKGSPGILFPYGYGLSGPAAWDSVSEDCPLLGSAESERLIFGSGRLGDDVSAFAGDAELADLRGSAAGFSARGLDVNAQEDARLLRWSGKQAVRIEWPEDSEGGSVTLRYIVDRRPGGKVMLGSDCDAVGCANSRDISAEMALAEGKGERSMVITEACLPMGKGDFALIADGSFEMKLVSAVRTEAGEGSDCSF